MSQLRLIGSLDNKNQRLTRRGFRSNSARSSHEARHSPICQLQRTLGNRRVARLNQAKRLTPEGKIIGLQRKLTVGVADGQYEQAADRVARHVMIAPNAVVENRCN